MIRRGTILAALLGASLVVNLVLAGLLLAGPRPPDNHRRGFDRMVNRIEAALPQADRARFRGVVEAERDRYAAPLAAVRASRTEVDAAIAREPFDPVALQAALDAAAARWMDFATAFNATLVDAVASVSPEGRARIAAAGPPDREQDRMPMRGR